MYKAVQDEDHEWSMANISWAEKWGYSLSPATIARKAILQGQQTQGPSSSGAIGQEITASSASAPSASAPNDPAPSAPQSSQQAKPSEIRDKPTGLFGLFGDKSNQPNVPNVDFGRYMAKRQPFLTASLSDEASNDQSKALPPPARNPTPISHPIDPDWSHRSKPAP